MRAALIAALGTLGLGACAWDPAPANDDVLVEPLECDQSVFLDGTSSAPVTLASAVIVPAGTNVCAHLDGTANARNHFAAGTASEDGPASSFVLTLLDHDGASLAEGWDVTVGATDPQTFANLEWSPEGSPVLDVILHVEAVPAGGATTSLSVWFFDPLE